jgi:hypothetical protein
MGSRYGQLVPVAQLADMPAPGRALVTHSVRVFARADRGVVRKCNDQTMDNRTAHFRDWLATSCGYTHLCCAKSITPPQAVGLIGAYIDHVAATPYNTAGDLPMANTLSHHAHAAFSFLQSVMTTSFSIYEMKGSKRVLVPFIGERISRRRKWQQPRPKREPYTFAMFATFYAAVRAQEQSPDRFLHRHSLVFDTQCLGIFTGSRVSEYAQSKGPSTSVSRVPSITDADPTATTLPVAFVAQDFTFLSSAATIIPHQELFLAPHTAAQLHITFRHDKSGRNYSVRKYAKGADWLCPITAATRLLYRARLLAIPPHDPICAHRQPRTQAIRFLRDTDVTDIMRQVCLDTYPDRNHFLRLNLQRISSHSNRITAAVALHHANMSIDDIAQRLRWKPESVSFYLRETATDIGAYTKNAIIGAHRNFC